MAKHGGNTYNAQKTWDHRLEFSKRCVFLNLVVNHGEPSFSFIFINLCPLYFSPFIMAITGGWVQLHLRSIGRRTVPRSPKTSPAWWMIGCPGHWAVKNSPGDPGSSGWLFLVIKGCWMRLIALKWCESWITETIPCYEMGLDGVNC